MPRQARVVALDCPHHITQRGNDRQTVFVSNQDRLQYLEFLKDKSYEHGLRILSYCLMTNHVHMVAIPTLEDSLALAIGQAHNLYSRYFNKLHGRTGHLWQCRYYSCPAVRTYLLRAMQYVECNPVRAFMVADATDYPWSSARANATGRDRAGILDMSAWPADVSRSEWREMLRAGQ